MIKKSRGTKFVVVFFGLLAICFSTFTLQAGSVEFTWAGSTIEGGDPGFTPSGSALFDISGSTLTVTLTNTTTQTLTSLGQVLTILTWDITDGGVMLVPVTAIIPVIPVGSSLMGAGATGDTDLSGEWGFKDDLAAGSTWDGPIGSFGISAVGDVNFGVDTFGKGDVFPNGTNLFGPSSGSLGGIDGGIVGPNVDFTSGGFVNQGPVVQNQIVFEFDITGGTLSYDEITNVRPLFGSDGVSLPEPSTLFLLLSGTGILAGAARFRKKS
jgi:hypothetical protein